LDLFCKAGGAAMGYHRAGFDVVGVDINPQPRYPFEFIQADVLTLDRLWIAMDFDAVHASPPCQGYTDLRHAPGALGAPRMIGAVRSLLSNLGDEAAWLPRIKLPFVIENVEGAEGEMHNPVTLCGSQFGLGAQGCQLLRHRLFETSFLLDAPACEHTEAPVVGVYGGHARKRSAKHGGRGTRDVWEGGHRAAASEAMGIDWMTLSELSEAIPPAYTEFIGRQLLSHLNQREAA